ncbi:hypothetical protein [Brucella anthropi]|uniref:hypothetical protein n=1 Tax=Brucella anthropi TaxID=529 RepID=UPI0023630B95|nr:hypothetical protein [Brucella anthropi]
MAIKDISQANYGDEAAANHMHSRFGASDDDIARAREQMAPPSRDWTKLSNILRRSCGGLSRTRSFRHQKV